jgi:hypothetical protein
MPNSEKATRALIETNIRARFPGKYTIELEKRELNRWEATIHTEGLDPKYLTYLVIGDKVVGQN